MQMQSLSLTKLCNSNKNASIKLECIRADENTNSVFNSVTTTVQEIIDGKTSFNSGDGGQLVITDFEIFVRPTLVDYLRSGWAISMVAAIDYTASNGNPSSPSSLHAMGPKNQYELAITNVGQVVEPYDLDKSFPVFGFGGIPRHMGNPSPGVSHCFAMNGNATDPSIFGIQGIVDNYRSTLP